MNFSNSTNSKNNSWYKNLGLKLGTLATGIMMSVSVQAKNIIEDDLKKLDTSGYSSVSLALNKLYKIPLHAFENDLVYQKFTDKYLNKWYLVTPKMVEDTSYEIARNIKGKNIPNDAGKQESDLIDANNVPSSNTTKLSKKLNTVDSLSCSLAKKDVSKYDNLYKALRDGYGINPKEFNMNSNYISFIKKYSKDNWKYVTDEIINEGAFNIAQDLENEKLTGCIVSESTNNNVAKRISGNNNFSKPGLDKKNLEKLPLISKVGIAKLDFPQGTNLSTVLIEGYGLSYGDFLVEPEYIEFLKKFSKGDLGVSWSDISKDIVSKYAFSIATKIKMGKSNVEVYPYDGYTAKSNLVVSEMTEKPKKIPSKIFQNRNNKKTVSSKKGPLDTNEKIENYRKTIYSQGLPESLSVLSDFFTLNGGNLNIPSLKLNDSDKKGLAYRYYKLWYYYTNVKGMRFTQKDIKNLLSAIINYEGYSLDYVREFVSTNKSKLNNKVVKVEKADPKVNASTNKKVANEKVANEKVTNEKVANKKVTIVKKMTKLEKYMGSYVPKDIYDFLVKKLEYDVESDTFISGFSFDKLGLSDDDLAFLKNRREQIIDEIMSNGKKNNENITLTRATQVKILAVAMGMLVKEKNKIAKN